MIPWVSVICLSYNHEHFVKEAVQSVLNQTYPNVELILVDDASQDLSQQKIKEIAAKNPHIKTLLLSSNVSNCKAFNRGLALAKGSYIIDFAADDVLLPTRVEEGVKALQAAGGEYGVHFSDAEWIGVDGQHEYFHSDKFPRKTVPQGDVYRKLIDTYFICPASTMATREVFTYLKGYDESLAYEDFDFLIRSSRKFKYVYSPAVLIKKRITPQGMSRRQFTLFSKDATTTFKVCEKIADLNRSADEQRALRTRIMYEIKQSLRVLNFRLVIRYCDLLLRNSKKRY